MVDENQYYFYWQDCRIGKAKISNICKCIKNMKLRGKICIDKILFQDFKYLLSIIHKSKTLEL